MKELKFPDGTFKRKFIFDEKYYEENGIADKSLHLVGAGMDKTILTFDDAALDKMDDGTPKRGTFRSYTMFAGGNEVVIEDMTIENSAGDGRVVGQAIALYADASKVTCKNVHLKGRQDTLFMSPLPMKEREENGFLGPRQNTPRLMTTQYYENCVIEGDVDFIFGGANAVFKNCKIISLYRPPIDNAKKSEASDKKTKGGEFVQGFVCAPSTFENEEGFKFIDCEFATDACPKSSVYLARPWREYAAASFENCKFGEHIAPEYFAGWKDIHSLELTARFKVYLSW